jgi:HlyD family secretion protein
MIENTSSMDRPVAAQRNTRLIVIAIGGAVVLLIGLALASSAIHRWIRADRAVDASTVRLGTVTRGDLMRDISVQGRVIASLSPALFSPGQGFVSLRTRAGSQVKRGDILAVVDSKELQAALEQAGAQLLTSRAELDRQKILTRQSQLRAQQQVDLTTVRLAAARRQLERVEHTIRDGIGNNVDLESARDNVSVAEMELAQAKNELGLQRETSGFEVKTREQQVLREQSVVGELQKRVDSLTIRAPFDGMVAAIGVQDRDAVAPNQSILTIVNLGSLEVEVGLPEEYASETAIGTPAAIDVAGHDYPGHVMRISPEVQNSEVLATVAFDGVAPAGLKQNQRLTTRLTFESKKNVLKVARGSFLESSGGRMAYVVDGKMATRRAIVTGATSVNEVEIVKGLREGEQIVVSDTAPFANAKNVMLR